MDVIKEDVDVHKKVNDPLPRKEVRVTIQLESPCRSVYMKCLSDELDSNKQAHRCAESHLDAVRDLNPNDGLTALCAAK